MVLQYQTGRRIRPHLDVPSVLMAFVLVSAILVAYTRNSPVFLITCIPFIMLLDWMRVIRADYIAPRARRADIARCEMIIGVILIVPAIIVMAVSLLIP